MSYGQNVPSYDPLSNFKHKHYVYQESLKDIYPVIMFCFSIVLQVSHK